MAHDATAHRSAASLVLCLDELRKLLAGFEKDTTFTGRRDDTLLRILIDTGIRHAEPPSSTGGPAHDGQRAAPARSAFWRQGDPALDPEPPARARRSK